MKENKPSGGMAFCGDELSDPFEGGDMGFGKLAGFMKGLVKNGGGNGGCGAPGIEAN